MIIFILTNQFCSNKEEKDLEKILDIFTEKVKVDKYKNCLWIGSNKWDDSTEVIIISNYEKKYLPKFTFYYNGSNYKNYDIFFSSDPKKFPVSNNLQFYHNFSQYSNPPELLYYDPEEVQLIYDLKKRCITDMLGNASTSIYFMKSFKEKGLMCK